MGKFRNDTVEWFNNLYDQFMDDGENEDAAQDMNNERIQPNFEHSFFQITPI